MADTQKLADVDAAEIRDGEYVRSQTRRTLYRILAANIVRELRNAGYHGHDLLGFASEVVHTITEDGWDGETNGRSNDAGRRSDTWPAYELGTGRHDRPVISSERLILRPPRLDDGRFLKSWGSEPRVQASLIPGVLKYVAEHLADLHTDSGRVDLIICDRPTEQPIGLVSLHDIDRAVAQAELGKVMGDPAFRGRGLAVEATRVIVAYGFDHLQLNRICLRTLGANVKNIRLNERMGFRFEGVLRQAAMLDGQPADVVLMAMLRSEFESGGGA